MTGGRTDGQRPAPRSWISGGLDKKKKNRMTAASEAAKAAHRRAFERSESLLINIPHDNDVLFQTSTPGETGSAQLGPGNTVPENLLIEPAQHESCTEMHGSVL